MRRDLLLSTCAAACLLTGCTPANTNATNPLRDMVASFATAREFDRADHAFRRDDDATLAATAERIKHLNAEPVGDQLTASFAAPLVDQATQLDTLARLSPLPEQKELLKLSENKLRVALQLLPEDVEQKGLNTLMLNNAGYILANRGETRTDLNRAVVLTHTALKEWPLQPTLIGPKPEVIRALTPQDSYAWALFRVGRYQEAKVQQEQVMKTARSLAPDQIPAEVPFHMAEIYRANGQIDKARDEYEAALKLSPDKELQKKIETALESLEKVRQVKMSWRRATL